LGGGRRCRLFLAAGDVGLDRFEEKPQLGNLEGLDGRLDQRAGLADHLQDASLAANDLLDLGQRGALGAVGADEE
jgi:hypothetical protein